MRLFCFDTVNGIIIGCSPTLCDDGSHGDEAYYQQGQWEEPPVDGGALGEVLQPLPADIPRQGSSNDETGEQYEGVVLTEHLQDLLG